MKTVFKRFLGICIVLLSLLVLTNYKVNADDSFVIDGITKYRVEKVIEEVELDFGISYHNDLAYTSLIDTSYVLGFEAGNESYSNKRVTQGTEYSQNVNVLEVPKDSGVEIVPHANINNGKWTLSTVKAMINKYEENNPGRKVIAAINGDFFDIRGEGNYPYTSTGSTSSAGENLRVNTGWKAIGFKNDGSVNNMFGNVIPKTTDKPYLSIFNEKGEEIKKVEIDSINSLPEGDKVACYFPFYDGSHSMIETTVNGYIASGSYVAPYSMTSLYGKGEITEIGERVLNPNQFGIVTSNTKIKELLKMGTTIRVQYDYIDEFAGVNNIIGYPANIITDGNPVTNADYRHPRTMIGIKADGTVVMTTCDGRQVSKGYYGVSPVEQAALMGYYGCVHAYNLDGGGSTTMVILQNGKFEIKNSPSDGSPRSDGNCLLLTVKVPTLNLSFEDVSTNSISIKTEIMEIEDKYKDLYVSLTGENYNELKKLSDVVTFDGLNKYTEYIYKYYAKIGDDMVCIPYTGEVNTAKDKFVINKLEINLGKTKNGKDAYIANLDITDEYKTVVTVAILSAGKRHIMDLASNNIVIETSKYLSFSNLHVLVIYDISDYTGRHEDSIIEYELVVSESVYLSMIANEANSWIDDIFR